MIGLVPASEIKERIKKLQGYLIEKGLAGALILENINLYYFSGSIFDGFLFVPTEKEPLLMVRKGVERIKTTSPFGKVIPFSGARELSNALQEYGFTLGKLGMELDVLPARDFMRIKKLVGSQLEIEDISRIIRVLRWKKSPYEIEQIKKSAKIHDQVFQEIPSLIYSGLYDWELATKIEYKARLAGHLGFTPFRGLNMELFMGHVLTGSGGAMDSLYDTPFGGQGFSPLYPQGSGGSKIKEGQPVSADYVGNYTGYVVDLTRSYCLGKPKPIFEKAYHTSLEIQAMVEEKTKPGVNGAYLYDEAVKIAKKEGLEDYFMGSVKFIGHGVGLEVNEWPVIAQGLDLILEKDQVFALEPKFIFPGKGLIGVENTYLIRDDGVEKLTLTSEELIL